jgi:hypothetical protein
MLFGKQHYSNKYLTKGNFKRGCDLGRFLRSNFETGCHHLGEERLLITFERSLQPMGHV